MLVPKSFYFVRHGQTDYNLYNRVTGGQIDIPLNATGEAQARALQVQIEGYTFPYVISSGMQRAIQTAQILTGNMPAIEPDLREWDVGEFGGTSADRFFELSSKLEDTLLIPGGESRALFVERVQRALNGILQVHPADGLIVSHGGVHWAIIKLLGEEPDYINNVQLIHFQPQADGTWKRTTISEGTYVHIQCK